MYHVPCPCGNQVPVELFQAGLAVNCTLCGAEIAVPSSIELKRLVGDPDPFLSLADKVSAAARHRDPPFDGKCHGCRVENAESEWIVTLTYLDERELDGDSGLTVAPGFLMLRSAGGRERWREIGFPLQLCSRCRKRFETERPGVIQRLFVNVFYGLFLIFALLVFVVLALVLHVGALVGVFVFAAILSYRLRKRGPDFLLTWLEPIPFVGDLVRGQDEYRISLGAPTKCSRPAGGSRGRCMPPTLDAPRQHGEESDRSAPPIVICPRCAVTVQPTQSGCCPSCRHVIADQ